MSKENDNITNDSVKNDQSAAALTAIKNEIEPQKTSKDSILGWSELKMSLLGYAANYYPKGTVIKVKPFTNEEVIYFSGINEENPREIEEGLDYLISNCVQIHYGDGRKLNPHTAIFRFDRLALILLARTYSDMQTKLTFEHTCSKSSCKESTTYELLASNIKYTENKIDKYFNAKTNHFEIKTAAGNFIYRPYTLAENKVAYEFMTEFAEELGKQQVVVAYKIKPFMRGLIHEDKFNDSEAFFDAFKSLSKKQIVALTTLADKYGLDTTAFVTVKCPACGHEEDVPMTFPGGIKSIVIDTIEESDFLL